MDVGLELRQARERRGLTLQDLSRTSKISLRVLQAIDAADEARLPPAVFVRSFVKEYAAYVGLDPGDTSRRYLEQFAPPAPPASADGDTTPAAAPTTRELLLARLLPGRFRATAGVVIAVAVVTLGIRSQREGQPAETREPLAAAVGTAGHAPSHTPETPAVGTAGVASAPEVLHLVIAPTGACWMSATANGERVFAGLLDAHSRKTIDAPDVKLRVGDPVSCAFSINGKPARVRGAAGQAVTVQITAANYAQFLQ